MTLSTVIFPTGTYTVTRTTGGKYGGDGRWVAGTQETFQLTAGAHPIDGRELEDVPTGQHGVERYELHTTTALRTRSKRTPNSEDPPEDVANDADVVEIDGEIYRVIKVEHFRAISNRYRVTVERIDTP